MSSTIKAVSSYMSALLRYVFSILQYAFSSLQINITFILLFSILRDAFHYYDDDISFKYIMLPYIIFFF